MGGFKMSCVLLLVFYFGEQSDGYDSDNFRNMYNYYYRQCSQGMKFNSQCKAFYNYLMRLFPEQLNNVTSSGNYSENDQVYSSSETYEKNVLYEYLQIDDVDSGFYDDPKNLPHNSCTRPCVRGQPMICYYDFTFEPYATLGDACDNCPSNIKDCFNKGCVTADGIERGILTCNKRMPAPSIQVCQGDLVVVDVKNKMPGRSTTIHWHGIRQQDSKFMDGVPMVTQCPINEATVFRYKFKVDEAGDSFYHPHDGLQKVDGIVGALIVRQPKKEDPNKYLYDYDLPSHVITIQDWYHLVADAMFPGLRFSDTEHKAESYVIQGRGQYLKGNNISRNTPLAEFTVNKGYRYVFHIIAGTCFQCQYVLKIEDHKMIVAGADVNPTKPYPVDSVTMSPGERLKIIVNCNRTARPYWMTVTTVGFCANMKAYQVAILRYKGTYGLPTTPRPTFETAVNNIGITLNPVNSNCTSQTRITEGPCMQHLRGAKLAPRGIQNAKPDFIVVWAFGFYFYTQAELYETKKHHTYLQTPVGPLGSTINGVIWKFPSSPLLSQYGDIPRNEFCPARGFPVNTWDKVRRECTHIIKVPAHAIVDLVFIDSGTYSPDGMSHSIHLHGYHMYMLEQGLLPQVGSFLEAYNLLMGYLKSKRRRPVPADVVTKDTFPLTSGGYAVCRIPTDNPGFWLLHCHFAYHLDSGMSAVLQVGDQKTFPKPPPHFPKCGNFLNDIKSL